MVLGNVQFQKIHTGTEGIRICWEVGRWGGGGFWKTKTFKEMYEASLEFPEEWRGVRKKSLLWGRSGYFLELHNVMMKFNVFSITEQMHKKLTSIRF